MSNKRFYWLKLKEDFFGETYIKALRRLPQGDSLAIVYLKMQLNSLKTEGIIKYQRLLPDSIAELAMALDEDENVVRLAVEALIRFGVVERWDDETLYMSAMQQLIGSETDSAARVRKHRELQGNVKALQCNTQVTNCNTEIEIEIELEKDIEKKTEKKKNAAVLTNDDITHSSKSNKPKSSTEKGKAPVRHKYGEYKNVLLSDEDMTKLMNEFPLDWKGRIERLSEYMASTGKGYKNHLATIRNWAKRDNQNQAGKRVSPNGIVIDDSKHEADDLPF